MTKLSREDKNILGAIFRGENPEKVACEYCGGLHERQCGRVKRKVFHANGNLVEIEFWPDMDWDQSNVVWPEDVFDPED